VADGVASRKIAGIGGAPGDDAVAPSFSSLGGGANQAGGRAYNERLTLSLIRLNGPLPKAELARLTGLSAQTLSQIVRRLESDGLLVAQEPLRGRIGQPSVPYALNALGVLSFGVKIGRRSAEVVLCNFLGEVLDGSRQTYAYPAPDAVMAFVDSTIARMRGESATKRFAGVGIAMPFELWKWADEVHAPVGSLDRWRMMDVAGEMAARTGLPAYVANDATAACGAELAFNHRGSNIELLYLFLGSFAGGGIVLNGALYQGRTGNAGALGSMPVALDGKRGQLIHHASLLMLERWLIRDGRDPNILQHPDADWSSIGETLDMWIGTAAEALASAIVASVSVIDFAHVCIDGAMPRSVLDSLVDEVRVAIGRHDLQGLSPFEIQAGTLGASARALGGAMLPIVENFASGQDVLLKALMPGP
jgi:predicted NBD/HSP70 family sugar kinase